MTALEDSKYLELPSLVGRSKKRVFGFIKDKVWQRIQGWKAKPISKAGADNNKGIKWLSWDNMSRPMCKGGLGFRNLHGFNIALLGKHCWKFIHQPRALVSRVFKARYFENTCLLQAQKGSGSSFIWAGLHEAKQALLKGFRWVLGDGEDIVAVKDQWLRKKSDFRVESSYLYEGRNEKVSQLFLPGTK
ncbi:putative mitochondrial protein AtMg00310 [Apium graveolens]|uniref:putative mitochondrial protein AtMg00310 n=1 Tax=Apium graveolens TaxID=4045 RepID=UPI003D7BAD20